jgi:hypothetical protein
LKFLIQIKIVLVLRFNLKKEMYKMPIYGKEWNWRNVKMEARGLNIVLRL